MSELNPSSANLPERLRERAALYGQGPTARVLNDAADEIERLQLALGARNTEAERIWIDEIERLRALLTEANLAFDDCTGDYAQELVASEPWREFHPDFPFDDEVLDA